MLDIYFLALAPSFATSDSVLLEAAKHDKYQKGVEPITKCGEDAARFEARMKLPANTVIAPRKLTQYLLRLRQEDYKSRFLALAGYALENADRLQMDIREQILPLDAELFDETEYGPKYRIRGKLTGPNGRVLRVSTIWMKEYETGQTNSLRCSPTSYEIRTVHANGFE